MDDKGKIIQLGSAEDRNAPAQNLAKLRNQPTVGVTTTEQAKKEPQAKVVRLDERGRAYEFKAEGKGPWTTVRRLGVVTGMRTDENGQRLATITPEVRPRNKKERRRARQGLSFIDKSGRTIEARPLKISPTGRADAQHS